MLLLLLLLLLHVFRITHEMNSSSVQFMPEEFVNEGFTLKTHQMFSAHTAPEEFKNAPITGHFKFVFEEKLGQGNHVIIVTSLFSKSFVVMTD